jgi:hypothetical protein
MPNNQTISDYIDCSVSDEYPNTNPFKCPYHPEAGCTLSRIIYNSLNDNASINAIKEFKKVVNLPKREEMLCNIDNKLLVDNDNKLVKIPVYTYKFMDDKDNSGWNILSVDKCSELDEYKISDVFKENVMKITFKQSDIDYGLQILNLNDATKQKNERYIIDACKAQQKLQNSFIPVSKEERIMAEKLLKTASNLSSQYSNDIAYNITNNVLNNNIPVKAYETTMSTTPASIIGAIALAGVKGALDNGIVLNINDNNNNGNNDQSQKDVETYDG